eukprot:g32791.t1
MLGLLRGQGIPFFCLWYMFLGAMFIRTRSVYEEPRQTSSRLGPRLRPSRLAEGSAGLRSAAEDGHPSHNTEDHRFLPPKTTRGSTPNETKVTIQYFALVVPNEGFKDECKQWAEKGVNFREVQHVLHAGDLAMCELLLDQGADIDARCSTDGTSSLHWACHSRTFRVVKLLLARRANPRLQDKRGHDALVKLVRRDVSTPAETCALSWHLQRSHRLAGPEETAGKMSIEDAKICAENLPETVGFSAHGVLEEVTLGSFYISFHGPGRAFVEDIPPPVKKKKKKKGEAVAPKAVPAEAVEAAVEVPAEEVPETAPVEAAPEAPVEAGAAEEAVQDAFPEEIPEVLEGEAEVDQTVEEVESEEESDDEPEELIWSHADPEWTSFLKVKNNAAHDVIALLSAAADPCAEDLDGLTALHHHLLSSPSRGSLDCVQALLRGGADVNHRDTHRSTTPFLLAVQSKRTDLVKAMLAHAWPPVDVDSQAPDGVCALALAQSLGAREIADLLRKAGASDWAGAELHLGSRTIFTYDTRKPPVNN